MSDVGVRLCALYARRAEMAPPTTLGEVRLSALESSRDPCMDIADYFARCEIYLQLTSSHHVVAYLYAARMTGRDLDGMHSRNVHKMLAVSNLLSLKFLSDRVIDMRRAAGILGTSCPELRSMEVCALERLGWSAYVGVEEYERCLRSLLLADTAAIPAEGASS